VKKTVIAEGEKEETRWPSERLDVPEESRARVIGRASYEPGWKVSARRRCYRSEKLPSGAFGMVLSGCATAAMDDGRVIEMRAGDVFYVGPGDDSRVVGDEPYVSLHLMGAGKYAKATKEPGLLRFSRS
jgi:hypothetical protein